MVAMATEEPPCQSCGSPVRVRTERGEMSLEDTRPPVIRRRVCTNPSCVTNQRDQPLNAVV